MATTCCGSVFIKDGIMREVEMPYVLCVLGLSWLLGNGAHLFFSFLDLFTFASENCRDVGEDPPTHVIMQG